MGYLFNDEDLKGNFDLVSKLFVLDDFMTEDLTDAATGDSSETDVENGGQAEVGETSRIPSFIDATFNARADKVVYDNINLTNVKGSLLIKDGKAILSNMTSDLFNGQVGFVGEVDTQKEMPTFSMNLDMRKLRIADTFAALELFKTIAPVADVLQGDFSSDIKLTGNLNNDFTPDLLSLSGEVLANVLTKKITPESAPVLSALSQKLDFINLNELDLKELKTKLSFKDGVVSVAPFTVRYKDMDIEIAGGHSFDQKLDYTATLQVPAKYLGAEVNQLIAKMGDDALSDVTVPVTANIGGAYTSPTVGTDLSSGVKGLTKQLVELQKQKLLDKGVDKAHEVLGGLLGKKKDTTGGDKDTSGNVKEVLGGLLNTKKSPTDSTTDADGQKGQDGVKDAAKDILGGLFGKKKGKTKKDSVN